MLAAAPAGREDERPDAVSELIFTSGTEAAPKAIMHTEETANFSVRVARQDLGLGDRDVVWMPSPIGHSTGFNYGVRLAIYHGLALVLQDRWDAAVACDLIAAHRASYTLASTTFLQDVVAEAERRGGDHLRSMTRFGCGGAPVPPELVRRAAACGIGVLRLYGSTEVSGGHLEPALQPASTKPPAPTEWRSPASRSRCATTAGAVCPPARPGRFSCEGPIPVSASTAIPSERPPPSLRAGGFDPATWPRWTRTAI